MAKAKTKAKPLRQLEGSKEKNALEVILQPHSESGQKLSFIDSVRLLQEVAELLAKKAKNLELSAGFDLNFDPHNPPQNSLLMADIYFRGAARGLGEWLANVKAGEV